MNLPNSTKILFIACVALLMGSCSDRSGSIKLAYPNKVNYESFIIANHLGYFMESNVPVEIITVNSGINAAESLTLGNADLAAMGDGPAVILMAQDKAVSIISRYAKGDRIHRIVSDTLLKAPGDLIGKRVGVQVGSSTYGAFLGWLDAHQLSIDTITVVPMDPLNMPEAMKNKQLDAVAGSEPWTLNVEKLCQNSVHELDNLQNEKNHFPHVLMANSKILDAKRAEIQFVINALNKANKFLAEYPDSAASIAAQYIGLTETEQKECLARLKWELDWTPSDLSSLEETASFFYRSKKITNNPDISKFLHIMTANK